MVSTELQKGRQVWRGWEVGWAWEGLWAQEALRRGGIPGVSMRIPEVAVTDGLSRVGAGWESAWEEGLSWARCKR